MLDVSIAQLASRLVECRGLNRYKELETVLISAKCRMLRLNIQSYVAARHSKPNCKMFSILPAMSSAIENSTVNVNMYVEILHSTVPATRAMFPSPEALARLLVVNTASSATAERSFSAIVED
jgi:hypothetical protein